MGSKALNQLWHAREKTTEAELKRLKDPERDFALSPETLFDIVREEMDPDMGIDEDVKQKNEKVCLVHVKEAPVSQTLYIQEFCVDDNEGTRRERL